MSDVFYVLRLTDPSGKEDHKFLNGRWGKMSRNLHRVVSYTSEDNAAYERGRFTGANDIDIVRVEINMRVVQ